MEHPVSRRDRDVGAAVAVVLIVTWVLLPAATGSESVQPEPATLEDLFGDTGNSFQASIGLLNLEGEPGIPATQGFGLAIDDMFVEWFEFTLETDETECSNGQCAVLDLPSSVLYEGVTSLPISMLDSSPYAHACVGGARDGQVCYFAFGDSDCPSGACVQAANDCDLDGDFFDPGDDDDCNDNGTPDVVVLATSEVDFGEIVVLDRISSTGYEYRGEIAVSGLADSDGVLYLVHVGVDAPTVVLTYLDHDDGTGRVCGNAVTDDELGRVQASASVQVQHCDVSVVSTSFTDNGDQDVFADSSETIELGFSVQNNCGFLVRNCVARLSTNSPAIECIKKGTVSLGDLAGSIGEAGPVVDSPGPFVFKLDDHLADRTYLGLTPVDALNASFNVAISCTEIDGITYPQDFALTLDMNLSDAGQVPSVWREDFEAGGTNPADPLQGTVFHAQNLDAGLPGNNNAEGLLNSDGWRCQYSDPDDYRAASYNHAQGEICYPGINLAQANAIFWQVDGSLVPGSPDGGRAFRGEKSMYYGIFLGQADEGFTTPLSTIESVATTEPINLGVGNPQLSFWQQISLADERSINTNPGRSIDRGVVQIKLHDSAGTPIGDWTNLQPIQNSYAMQAETNYFNCTFDPTDDGNDEDDYFDPTDPAFREFGPSSTCYPEFSWSFQGSTTGSFDVIAMGNATVPPSPGDVPDLGVGTWVQSIVDLSEFRGRRAKLRYIVTSLKAVYTHHVQQFGPDRDERDDGWWIDEIEITEVLSNPATLENDDYTLGSCSVSGDACINQCEFSLAACTDDSDCGISEACMTPCPVGQSCLPDPPGCGPVCTTVTANAFVTPNAILNPGSVATPAPGQVLTINGAAPPDAETGALPSSADACLSGNLQYRFCRDGDPLGGGSTDADGDCDDTADQVLRGWTENSVLTLAPQSTAGYTLEVRCSAKKDCLDSERVQIDVTCPGAANALGLRALRWADKNRLEWSGAPLPVDYWTSDSFGNAAELAHYPGAMFTSVGPVNSLDFTTLSPDPGTVVAVLVKADGDLNTISVGYYCNSVTWRSGGSSEIPETGFPTSAGRDNSIETIPS